MVSGDHCWIQSYWDDWVWKPVTAKRFNEVAIVRRPRFERTSQREQWQQKRSKLFIGCCFRLRNFWKLTPKALFQLVWLLRAINSTSTGPFAEAYSRSSQGRLQKSTSVLEYLPTHTESKVGFFSANLIPKRVAIVVNINRHERPSYWHWSAQTQDNDFPVKCSRKAKARELNGFSLKRWHNFWGLLKMKIPTKHRVSTPATNVETTKPKRHGFCPSCRGTSTAVFLTRDSWRDPPGWHLRIPPNGETQ